MQGLREIRKRYGLTQQQLANLLGVSVGFICHIERGRKNMPLEKMRKLSKIFSEGGEKGWQKKT